MDDLHAARRDSERGNRLAPNRQSNEYRGELDRLDRERQGKLTDVMSGPLPAGYGDGDPRMTLVVLGLYVAAVIVLGGMALSGLAQMMAIGWLALLIAVLLVPALLFSPFMHGLTRLQGAAAKKARRDAFLVLLLSFGAGRLLGGGVLIGQVAPFLAGAALLFVLLRNRLPQQTALVLALANTAGVLLVTGIAWSLLSPFVMTMGG